MKPVKRIEIVTDAPHTRRVVKLLADRGITGWTVIRNTSGSGKRGRQLGDEITGVSSNSVIVTTCEPDQLDALAEELRRLLERIGGICLVSDAHWLID